MGVFRKQKKGKKLDFLYKTNSNKNDVVQIMVQSCGRGPNRFTSFCHIDHDLDEKQIFEIFNILKTVINKKLVK